MVTSHLSPYLLDFLDEYCRLQADQCEFSACNNEQECQSARLSLTLVADRGSDPEFSQFRRSVRDLHCQQCTLLLVLQAIHRNVPAAQHADWMRKPLIDLKGRTPQQCIETKDFDALIDALWLLDESGQTCG